MPNVGSNQGHRWITSAACVLSLAVLAACEVGGVNSPQRAKKKSSNASYRIRTCAGKAQTITRKFLISKESRNHTFLLVDLLNHSDKLASVKMTKLCLLILCQHRQTQSRFGVLLFEPAFKKSHTPGMHFPLFLAVGQICCLSRSRF